MAASTADRYNLAQVDIAFLEVGVSASTTIYKGTCVCFDGGYLSLAADTAGFVFCGISLQNVTESTGVDGAVTCRVMPLQRIGYMELDAVSPALATWLGVLVYFSDDHTVALAATTSQDICAGRVVSIPDTSATGRVVVDVLDRFAL